MHLICVKTFTSKNPICAFFTSFRDLVHRQTAMYTIHHMTLGVYGFGCEDALNHLLNYVWPNVFETSPHVVQAFMGSIEGMRLGLGPTRVMQYALQVSIYVESLSHFIQSTLQHTAYLFLIALIQILCST